MEAFMNKVTAWLRSEIALKILSVTVLVCSVTPLLFVISGLYGTGGITIQLLNILPEALLVAYVFYFRNKWSVTKFRFIYLLVMAGIALLYIIAYFFDVYYLPYSISNSMSQLGGLALVSVYLFSLPQEEAAPNPTASLPPEEKLKLLKEKYELGILSEEDYRAQKAEILDTL